MTSVASSFDGMATPRRLVHWASEVTSHDIGTPCSDASSESSCPTSTMDHVNSQLVAQGFSAHPGLCFDGLSKADGERIMNCLMSLLKQRVDDTSCTEDLATKLRTLSYDHDRLTSMHKSSLERAANAEKEANLHKSRLATATKELQTLELTHKHTIAELQRTRTAMQSLRTTQAAELKRRDKEVERMQQQWAKISDSQLKLGAASAGITFKSDLANACVGNADAVLGKGTNILEEALDDAEKARAGLSQENGNLKDLMLYTVNSLQSGLHKAQISLHGDIPEPTRYTLLTLFSASAVSAARDKVVALLKSLNEILGSFTGPKRSEEVDVADTISPEEYVEVRMEARRLQNVVADLREELDKEQKAHAYTKQKPSRQPIQGKEIIPEERATTSKIPMAVEPLKQVNDAMTAAKSFFAKGKAFFEDEQMPPRSDTISDPISEFKPADGCTSTPSVPGNDQPLSMRDLRKHRTKGSSPHRSPAKGKRQAPKAAFAVPVGKAALASSKRGYPGKPLSLMPRSPSKVIPSFQTEYIPPLVTRKNAASRDSQPLILPASFVLPPPSPLSSIPPADMLTSSSSRPPDVITESKSSSQKSKHGSSNNPSPILTFQNAPDLLPPIPESSDNVGTEPESEESAAVPPDTPDAARHTLNVPKPFGSRPLHAFSPARPSPLSRILMMSESPNDPPMRALDTLSEEEEELYLEENYHSDHMPVVSLETDSGMDEDDVGHSDESPLREKNGTFNDNLPPLKTGKKDSSRRKKGTGKDPARPKRKATMEKENNEVGTKSKVSRGLASNTTAGAGVRAKLKTSGALDVKDLQISRASGAKTIGGKSTGTKGGARRVPIGSEDAAPVGPAWRG